MSTSKTDLPSASSNAKATHRQPVSFAEWFTVLNGIVPMVILMSDARFHRLGADPIRSSLQITGAYALLLLLLTLAITPIRTLTRWNWLHQYRRPLGLMTFLYAVSHLAIYVGYDQAWELTDAWSELLQRRYLQLGAVAMLVMIPLALTSTPRMVKLLTIQRWKKLHRLTYLAAVASVAHYWLQSKANFSLQMGAVVAVTFLLGVRLIKFRRSG